MNKINYFAAYNFRRNGDHLNYIFPVFKQLFCLLNGGRKYPFRIMCTTFRNTDPGALHMQSQNTLAAFIPIILYGINASKDRFISACPNGWHAMRGTACAAVIVNGF